MSEWGGSHWPWREPPGAVSSGQVTQSFLAHNGAGGGAGAGEGEEVKEERVVVVETVSLRRVYFF